MRVLAPYISCVVDNDAEFAQAKIDGYSIIYAARGGDNFQYRKLSPGRGGAHRYVIFKVPSIPGVEAQKPIREEICFLPDGKIPMHLLESVKAFFKAVIDKRKSAVEAMIWIMWNEEQGYFLHVPNQTVSGASASYDWTNLPEKSTIVVDIHSHANFGAFFSGTDNRDDDNSVRFSGVIGDNLKPTLSMCWRFNCMSSKFDVKMEDIFEEPKKEEPTVPAEWLDKVGTPSYSGNRGVSIGHGSYFPSSGNGQSNIPGFSKSRPNAEFGGKRTVQGNTESFPSPLPGRANGGNVTSAGQTSSPANDFGFFGDSEYGGIDEEAFSEFFRKISTPDGEEKNALNRRISQEDLLSDQAEDHLGPVSTPSPGEVQELKDSLVVTLSNDYLPAEYDYLVANHGLTVAAAITAVNFASYQLNGNKSLVTDAMENLMLAVPSDEQLAVFRAIFEMLPKDAQMKVQTEGL